MAKGLGINEKRAVGREREGGRVGWGIISMTVGIISTLFFKVKKRRLMVLSLPCY